MDSRFHLASIVESSDDPIIGKDLGGVIVSWNRAAVRVFGYDSSEIVGRSILTLIPPELHHEEKDLLSSGERVEHFETIRMRKNGERFPVSVTISPIRDDQGRVIGASKIVRDITDRQANEESHYHLAAIIDSAHDAIISKDLNGIVRTWNQGARRIFGYTSEEMVGQSIKKLIPPELYPEEDEILHKLRAGERIEHYETKRRRKSGETVEISVTISPIRDKSGRVVGASKIARDISDRKRIEQLLIQSEKLAATGRMAATIAHEINNPLESLMNLIYLARTATPASSEAQTFLLTAEEELKRVSHIARQTLGYYKDTGQPTELHLHDLIENVLTVYRSKLQGAGIEVMTSYADAEKIVISRGEMLQVLSNIIANAIDAMRNGGQLHVFTRSTTGNGGKGIQVVIRDTGKGIAQEHLARVFEPFFTTKGNLGTGVGLWVARQLVERRGGTISITSSTGHGSAGTTLTIFVPLVHEASNEASNGAEATAA